MSLILDALRKSEAERRRGQSPDLFAASPGVPSPPAARPRVWPLLVLGAMLLASAWLIWSSGGDARPPAVIEPADVEPSQGVDGADAATPAPAPRPETRPVTPDPAPAAIAPPAHAVAPGRPVGSQPPAPPPASASAVPSVPPTSSATPPASPLPPLPFAPAADPPLPPLAVLDAATRARLPALKLSMHVYADEPARRFAIIDGQRVAEGARVGDGVVAAIRRDGVVIEVDGRRVLLPRP